MKKIDLFFQKYADRLVWVFILTYILIFGYLSFLKYQSFNYFDWDLASDAIVLWNSVHGRFLYYPFLEQSIFGCHLYLITLFILPIYAIFQSPLTVLFLQSIFLGLAAFPLYLLARIKLNKIFSLSLVVAYLLYPPLGFINLFETHVDIYMTFFLLFALYYFEKEKFRNFLVFIFFTLLCKENASLVVFMFGVYALIRRRSKVWVLAPLLAGATWFLLSVKVVIPYFAKDAKLYQDGFIFSFYYEHLGSNLFEMAKTVIFHPLSVASYAFTPQKIFYLTQVFFPIGFLGLLSPVSLLPAIPIFMQNLLSEAPTHSSIYYHYVALLIPFIFFSVIQAFSKLLRQKFIAKHQAMLWSCFFGCVVFAGVYLKAPQFNVAEHVFRYQVSDYSKEKEKLIKLIPKDSCVVASFQFLPKLANRRELYSLHFIATGYKMYTNVTYKLPENLEYALIDFNEPLMVSAFFPPSAPRNIRSFLGAGDWMVFKAFNDIVLFKKNYKQGTRLCEIVRDPKIGHPINLDLNKEMLFLGYDVVDDQVPGSRVLHLVYYWKRIKGNSRPVGFFIQFSDTTGNARFQSSHIFGYRVYLQDEWKEGQVVKEHQYILIPSWVKNDNYDISFRPFIF